jgi:hypothetical protein
MKSDRAVQIYWCRWVPRGDSCKDKLVGDFGSIKEAQKDGWDVLRYQDEKGMERVGIILPKRFGGRLVSAAAPVEGPIQITFRTCCAPFTVLFSAPDCDCELDDEKKEALLTARAKPLTNCVTCGGIKVCGNSPQCH